MLQNEAIIRFEEEGFLVFERLLSQEKHEHYLAIFDELVAKGNALSEPIPLFSLELDAQGQPLGGMLHKVQGVCVVEPRLLELARAPAIVDRVAALAGPAPRPTGTRTITTSVLPPTRCSLAASTCKMPTSITAVSRSYPAATVPGPSPNTSTRPRCTQLDPGRNQPGRRTTDARR